MPGIIAVECAEYNIISYELFIIMERMCHHQHFIAYLSWEHMFRVFIKNYNTYHIDNHKHQGKISWCQSAMIAVIKHAIRPNISLKILNYMANVLLNNLIVYATKFKQEQRYNNDSIDSSTATSQSSIIWNECCMAKFLYGLCIAIDCTEDKKSIKDIDEKQGGGLSLIKKLSNICVHVFTKLSANTLQHVVTEAYNLLSRINIMNTEIYDDILKQMRSDQRIKYNHEYYHGKSQIDRFKFTQPIYPMAPVASQRDEHGNASNKYRSKYMINKLGSSLSRWKKLKVQRIIDIMTFDKLQNPFEFPLTIEDIICAFRHADLDEDNIISFSDFQLSVINVGIVFDEQDTYINAMWAVLNECNDSKGITLETFEQKLREYPRELHHWFCRIVSRNHLARQPFKTDPNGDTILKVFSQQNNIAWRQRV
eukprot:158009_1